MEVVLQLNSHTLFFDQTWRVLVTRSVQGQAEKLVEEYLGSWLRFLLNAYVSALTSTSYEFV